MNIFFRKTVAIVLFLLYLPVSYAISAEEQKLIDAFNSNSVEQIIAEINNAKKYRYKGDLNELLINMWYSKNDNTVSSKMMQKDIVRVNVADYLIQAYNNQLIDIDISGMHDYVKSLLKKKDPEVLSVALLVIGKIDDPQDVDLLEPFLLSDSMYLFRSATIALAMMCNKKAVDKVSNVLSKLTDHEKKEFMIQTVDEFNNMKQLGGICKQRDH